jgi:hypothetical protein
MENHSKGASRRPQPTETSWLRQLANNYTSASTPVVSANNADESVADGFQWTAVTALQSLIVFFLAGVAEIGGG